MSKTINGLSSASDLQPEDEIAIWQNANRSTRKASLSNVVERLSEFIEGQPDETIYSLPTGPDGFVLTVLPTTPGGSVWAQISLNAESNGTVILPGPNDRANNQEILITTTAAVPSLVVNGQGAEVRGAPSSLSENGAFMVRYDSISESWFLVATASNKAVQNNSDDWRSNEQNIYRRSIKIKNRIRFPGYENVTSAKGYQYLFPQGLTIHEGLIYILYGAGGSGNTGSYVAIYKFSDGSYVSGFSFGLSFGEGIIVRREDGKRIMEARYTSGVLGFWDITTLPVDQATVEPYAQYNLRYYSLMCWDGYERTMQVFANADAPSAPRNHFVRFASDLTFKSRLELDPADAWSISDSLISLNPKLQGITATNGSYITSYGGTHYYGGNETQDKLVGIKVLTDTGNAVQSGLMRPDAFIDILRGEGCTVDLIENEGVCTYQGRVYALWVTSSHTNTGDYGIVITQELQGEIDCTSAGVAHSQGVNVARLNGTIAHDITGIKNPLTNQSFATLEQVIEFMRDTQVTRYGFYTTNSTVSDLSGAEIATGLFVQILTGSYISWEVTITGQNTLTRYWVTGNKGSLTQATSIIMFGGTPSNSMNSVMIGPGGAAKISLGRNNVGNVSLHEFYNPNGVVGRIATLANNTRYYIGLNAFITGGSGTPEGAVTAPVGSMFLRENGGAGTTLYVKETGTGNTGWIAK